MEREGAEQEDTPTAQLQSIIDTPDKYDFGESFMMGGHAVGMSAAREVEDASLLRSYRELCDERLPGDYFADNPMVRERAEDKFALLDTLDDMIQSVEFPSPNEWSVDPDFVEFVQSLSLPSVHRGRQFDRQGWERVWDACTAEELQFVRRALAYAPTFGSPGHSSHDDVLATMLYYRDEGSIDDLFTISTRGDGPSKSTVARNLAVTLDRLDPVIGSMAVYWISSVTTNISESGCGRYQRGEKRINVSSDSRVDRTRDRDGYKNTTAHEVGHALHHLYGFWVQGGSDVDNRNRDVEEWKWKVQSPSHEKTSTTQDAFRAVIRQEWEKMRRGNLSPLEEYQTKNADELIAVAFECWIVDPQHLERTQPRLARLFEANFGEQDYGAKQLRLEVMPSPKRCKGTDTTTKMIAD